MREDLQETDEGVEQWHACTPCVAYLLDLDHQAALNAIAGLYRARRRGDLAHPRSRASGAMSAHMTRAAQYVDVMQAVPRRDFLGLEVLKGGGPSPGKGRT